MAYRFMEIIQGTKQTDELNTCSICLNELLDPETLPCSHSFCRTCIESYKESTIHPNKFQCPICCSEIQIDDSLSDKMLKSLSTEYKTLCSTCDHDVDIGLRCINCEQILCKDCVRIHGKLSATKEHTIVKLEPFPKQPEQFCTSHPEEMLTVYCLDCSEVMCNTCYNSYHEDHLFRNVAELAQEIRARLECQANEAESNLITIGLEEQQKLAEVDTNEKQIITCVKQRAESLINKITKLSEETTARIETECKYGQHVNKRNIKNIKQTLGGEIDRLREARSQIARSLDAEIVCSKDEHGKKFGKICKITSTSIPECSPCLSLSNTFTSGETENEKSVLRKVFGFTSLTFFSSKERELRKIQEFIVSEHNKIKAICSKSDRSLWIAFSSKLCHYNRNGKCLKIVKLEENVECCTCDAMGNMYVSAGNVVMKYDTDLNKTIFVTVNETPDGIAINWNGDVCICYRDIFIYSPTGVLQEKLSDKLPNQHVSYMIPLRCIACSSAGDMVVIRNQNGQMTLFDRENCIEQQEYVSTKKSNTVFSIISDKCGNWIVSEEDSKTIYLFDRELKLTKYLLTKHDVISPPTALSLDDVGYLWIGFADGSVRCYEYN